MSVQDKKLLMWDLRTCQAQAAMDVPGQPHGAMDEEGLVFAVACSSGLVSMFDARQYSAGPFLSFPLPLQQHGLHSVSPISHLKFSANAQHLMAVVQGKIFIMDTFDGREVLSWSTGVEEGGTVPEASFSADGLYAISGVARSANYRQHLLTARAAIAALLGLVIAAGAVSYTRSGAAHH